MDSERTYNFFGGVLVFYDGIQELIEVICHLGCIVLTIAVHESLSSLCCLLLHC